MHDLMNIGIFLLPLLLLSRWSKYIYILLTKTFILKTNYTVLDLVCESDQTNGGYLDRGVIIILEMFACLLYTAVYFVWNAILTANIGIYFNYIYKSMQASTLMGWWYPILAHLWRSLNIVKVVEIHKSAVKQVILLQPFLGEKLPCDQTVLISASMNNV